MPRPQRQPQERRNLRLGLWNVSSIFFSHVSLFYNFSRVVFQQLTFFISEPPTCCDYHFLAVNLRRFLFLLFNLLPFLLLTAQQGVIWGKDPKHFVGRSDWLKAAASVAGVTLHSTLSTRDAPASLRNLPNIVFHGHLTKPAWQKLLAESS